jgi:hypothetical protein
MGRGFESLLRYHIVARSCEAPVGRRPDAPSRFAIRLPMARDPAVLERPRMSALARSALGVGAQEPVQPPGPAEVPPERPPPPEEAPPVPPAEAPPREDPPEIQPPPDIPPSTPPDEIPEPPPQRSEERPSGPSRRSSHQRRLQSPMATPARQRSSESSGARALADRSHQWVAQTGRPRYYIRFIA